MPWSMTFGHDDVGPHCDFQIAFIR